MATGDASHPVVMGEAVIVAGIGSRKGVTVADVVAAIEHALEEHGLGISAISALATTAHKRDEKAIFEAGEQLGLSVMVVELAGSPSSPPGTGGEVVSEANRRGSNQAMLAPISVSPFGLDTSPPLREGRGQVQTLTASPLSLAVAGTPSVSEAAALAAAGPSAKLLGPRTVFGPVTCAIAMSEDRP